MLNPGIYELPNVSGDGDFVITAAQTLVGKWVEDLAGILSLTFQLRFAYGSGGATCKAYLQTSLDQGDTALDIACIALSNVSAHKLLNFSALTPRVTPPFWQPTDGAMADDTALDGVLGDRYRLKVTSTGVYTLSTVLVGRIHAH